MNKKITVSISYFDFEFSDVDAAVQFAETAARTIEDKDKDISVIIKMEGEEDE